MKTKCTHLRFEFRLVFLIPLFFGLSAVQGITDPSDVEALQELYISLNCSSQLTGWTSVGGDPCEESWMGITCQGSAIVSIQISGLGLSGSMGYMLSGLGSLNSLDVSDNRIHESIPYQLPPNLTKLNIAKNNFSGNLPYSIAILLSLSYLNTSNNSLGQPVGDIFTNLTDLLILDLSHNNFSGYLPTSFASLSNILVLHLQNNQLTGSLNVLDGLPLTDLNVANNNLMDQYHKRSVLLAASYMTGIHLMKVFHLLLHDQLVDLIITMAILQVHMHLGVLMANHAIQFKETRTD